jgi:hypothetical protein
VINAIALIVWAAVDRRLPDRVNWRIPALWLLPLLAFFVFVHIGRPGYVLALLAPVALILGGFYARQRTMIALMVVALQAAANIAHFTQLTPFSVEATGGNTAYRDKTRIQRAATDLQPVTFPTAFTIAQSDERVDRLRQLAATTCPDGDFVIVAASEPVDWRRVMWYLPEARAIYIVNRLPVYVAQHTDFSPIPPEGLDLPSKCPAVWLASSGLDAAAQLSGDLPATAVSDVGWTLPAGVTFHVSRSGVKVTP